MTGASPPRHAWITTIVILPPPIVAPVEQLSIASKDVDEVRSALSRVYGRPISLEPAQTGAFEWAMRTSSMGGVRLSQADATHGARWRVEAAVRYGFLAMRTGAARGSFGPHEVDVLPWQNALLLEPGHSVACSYTPGAQTLVLTVDRETLHSHYTRLTNDEVTGHLRFDPSVPLDRGGAGGLTRLLELVANEDGRPDGLTSSAPVRATLRSTILTALLTSLDHDHARALSAPVSSVAPGRLRRAEEWIDAHAADPITMPDVAAAVGVSVRALQELFRRYRQTTPQAFLRDRRLALARRALLDATPGQTVRTISLHAGFAHAGRFAADYQRLFGETPTETLRAALAQRRR